MKENIATFAASILIFVAAIGLVIAMGLGITSCVRDQRNAENFRQCTWNYPPEQCEYLR